MCVCLRGFRKSLLTLQGLLVKGARWAVRVTCWVHVAGKGHSDTHTQTGINDHCCVF